MWIPGHRPDPSSGLFSCVRDAESLNVEQIFTQLQLIWQIRGRLGTERDCRSVVISRTYSLHASSSSCNTYLHFIYHHQCAAPPSACRRCCTRATVRAWVCARAHGHAYMPVAAYVYDFIGRLLTDIWGFKHILKLHMSPPGSSEEYICLQRAKNSHSMMWRNAPIRIVHVEKMIVHLFVLRLKKRT